MALLRLPKSLPEEFEFPSSPEAGAALVEPNNPVDWVPEIVEFIPVALAGVGPEVEEPKSELGFGAWLVEDPKSPPEPGARLAPEDPKSPLEAAVGPSDRARLAELLISPPDEEFPKRPPFDVKFVLEGFDGCELEPPNKLVAGFAPLRFPNNAPEAPELVALVEALLPNKPPEFPDGKLEFPNKPGACEAWLG